MLIQELRDELESNKVTLEKLVQEVRIFADKKYISHRHNAVQWTIPD